ncbi:MAG TPA: ATP-binding protein [Solirubrobacteraceae bacterium]
MKSFVESRIWREALAEQAGVDPYADERARLRRLFLEMRQASQLLAEEIKRDLPSFTRHDRVHHDALWHLASLVTGPTIDFLPSEAFVLGATFLVHDLGLGVAAYPDPDALQHGAEWSDAVAQVLRATHGEKPSPEDIANPKPEVARQALETVLRERHAECAEELAVVSWTAPGDPDPIYLLDDFDARHAYGRLIGRIAHSHWLAVAELPGLFGAAPTEPGAALTAPSWLPEEWTVDALKLACVLRLADAVHLDASRAPALSWAIRRPPGISDDHWKFQERLHQPTAQNDRLVFTAGQAFRREDADAWWLCLAHLRQADAELRSVDALLADLGRPRFLVRGVSGVDDTRRLSRLIPTDGWLPRETPIRVGDAPNVLEKLLTLFSRDLAIALREIIQNAIDAVTARRCQESLPDDWGQLDVRLHRDGEDFWLEVEDTGVGMTAGVMESLPDYGQSLWESAEVVRELPGLLGKGFDPIGRYGVGFFAVFALGERVTVTSRRAEAARSETLVMELDGLRTRPMLRPARLDEQRTDGGTTVRIRLSTPPHAEGGLLYSSPAVPAVTIMRLCGYVAPGSDVTIHAEEDGQRHLVLTAGDWKTIEDLEVIDRPSDPRWWRRASEQREQDAVNLTPIYEPDGTMVGRCAMRPLRYSTDAGVVMVGGLRAESTMQLVGLLVGRSTNILREGTPTVSPEALGTWATGQARLIHAQRLPISQQMQAARSIYHCGGDPGPLPICISASGPLTLRQLILWAGQRHEILLVNEDLVYRDWPSGTELSLGPDCIAGPLGQASFLQTPAPSAWPLSRYPAGRHEPGVDPVHRAIAEAWGTTAETEGTVTLLNGRHTLEERAVASLDGKPISTVKYHAYVRPSPTCQANERTGITTATAAGVSDDGQ